MDLLSIGSLPGIALYFRDMKMNQPQHPFKEVIVQCSDFKNVVPEPKFPPKNLIEM